jgi:hypothetical protein
MGFARVVNAFGHSLAGGGLATGARHARPANGLAHVQTIVLGDGRFLAHNTFTTRWLVTGNMARLNTPSTLGFDFRPKTLTTSSTCSSSVRLSTSSRP